ncbi:Dpb2p [Coccidioides immitis H538.4]|uniref:DNA polymerase epsilon subunit B n=1 Tax=Coccidioides immitis H538.4 TaxID=396776 RepID=A0A0J8RTN7_COCIT|nr:Dpb2p [Coccidioides immitis H538.4]
MPVGHSKNERHHDTYTDDMASDFRATAPDLERSRPTENNRIKENVGNVAARKLVKSILDQGHLSPFPTTTRAVFWDHASALYLYPLPTCLILADTSTGPFSVTYEGCHVLNPGKFVTDSAPNKVTWAEYDISTCKSSWRILVSYDFKNQAHPLLRYSMFIGFRDSKTDSIPNNKSPKPSRGMSYLGSLIVIE